MNFLNVLVMAAPSGPGHRASPERPVRMDPRDKSPGMTTRKGTAGSAHGKTRRSLTLRRH